MYWWNIKALASELKSGKVSPFEKFKYFFAFMLVTSIFVELIYLFPLPESPTLFDYASSILVILITILGLILCYKSNKKGDNKDFIERFVCLSWPITIRLIVIIIAISVPYYLVIGDSLVEVTTIVDVLFIIGYESAFYFWIYRHISQISATKKGKKA